MTTGNAFLVLSAFLASAVEMVEALTIVLASALARGWRSSLAGVGAATLALAAITAALGPALTAIPLNALRLAVGALLLVFGLQWLRKAILRASGFKALHDEDAIFARELADAEGAERVERAGLDWYGFVLSFKGVLLEGLEVVFIVLTFGSAQHSIPLAAVGAAGALDPRRRRRHRGSRPARARAGEPHEVHRRRDAHDVRDLLVDRGRRRALARRGRVAARRARLRHRRLARARAAAEAREARGRDRMKWLVGFGRFWWDFVVGDDWRVALLVAIAIGATAVARARDARHGLVADAGRRAPRPLALAPPRDTFCVAQRARSSAG